MKLMAIFLNIYLHIKMVLLTQKNILYNPTFFPKWVKLNTGWVNGGLGKCHLVYWLEASVSISSYLRVTRSSNTILQCYCCHVLLHESPLNSLVFASTSPKCKCYERVSSRYVWIWLNTWIWDPLLSKGIFVAWNIL